MEFKDPLIIKTWKGNKNGSILLTIPDSIKKQYHLENPTNLILERQENGFFLRKLVFEVKNNYAKN
jgi:hypothetical protein